MVTGHVGGRRIGDGLRARRGGEGRAGACSGSPGVYGKGPVVIRGVTGKAGDGSCESTGGVRTRTLRYCSTVTAGEAVLKPAGCGSLPSQSRDVAVKCG